jgi:WD40 repeat protein
MIAPALQLQSGSRAAQSTARSDIVNIYIWTKPDASFSTLASLFRGVGYEAVVHETEPQSASAGSSTDAHLVIVGSDSTQLPERLSRLQALLGADARIVCLAASAPTAEADRTIRRSRAALIVPDTDIYSTFERIAGAFNFDVSADVFVSYSLKNRLIADALIADLRKNGLRSWIDRRNLLPSEEWRQALRRGVATSGTFLFLVSRTSASSPNCLEELGWAEDLGKRVVPVMIEAIPYTELPQIVSKRQFISVAVQEGADPPLAEADVARIVDSLQRDPKDTHIHRDLLIRALEWRRQGDDPDKLLRGRDLQEAEDWLGQATARALEPRPVALHADFIAASREAARKRRRTTMSLGAATLLTIAALAIWAVLSAIEAGRQEREARSRLAEQRAFGAYVDADSDPVKAFLQADSAMRTAPDGDALQTGYETMTRSLGEMMPEAVFNLESGVSTAAFSSDLTRLAFQAVSSRPQLVTLGPASTALPLEGADESFLVRLFKFSADGRLLAGIGRARFAERDKPYTLNVWRAENGTLVGSGTLEFSGGDARVDVLGFTGDGRHIVVESNQESTGFVAHVLATDAVANGPVGTPWQSKRRFLVGSIDLASGNLVQVEQKPDHALVHVRTLATGGPAFPWSPLRVDGDVLQAYLTRHGRGLVLNARASESNQARIAAFKILENGSLLPNGELVGPGPVLIWRASQDASTVAVINSGADYPGELWSPAKGLRVSVPVGKRLKDVFVMKTGEEYRPIDLISDDRFVLTRIRIEGTEAQQILLFDRDSLRLAATPFTLQLRYLAMQVGARGTELATISQDGMVERWDLLRRKLPQEQTLSLEGPVLGAHILPDRTTLLTRSRIGERSNYAARIDLWDLSSGKHAGRLPATFDTRVHLAVNSTGSRLATVSGAKGVRRIQVWDLPSFTSLWSVENSTPVETVTFRENDSRIATIGQDETRAVVLAEYDAGNGRTLTNAKPALRTSSTHLVFSADGEHVIADYDYATVLIWGVRSQANIAAPFEFSDAGGMPFDLGYDIIRTLRNIRIEGAAVTGDLPGPVVVRLNRDGPGMTLTPVPGDTPILSAFQRNDARFYPVRGAELVSPTGRWFALATNVGGVENASALRIYDLLSGFPISEMKFHQVQGGPEYQWPRLLSGLVHNADPIKTLTFLGSGTEVVTVTTNGILRRWPISQDRRDRTRWKDPSGYASAMTGRQLVSARYVRRLSRAEHVKLLDEAEHR